VERSRTHRHSRDHHSEAEHRQHRSRADSRDFHQRRPRSHRSRSPSIDRRRRRSRDDESCYRNTRDDQRSHVHEQAARDRRNSRRVPFPDTESDDRDRVHQRRDAEYFARRRTEPPRGSWKREAKSKAQVVILDQKEKKEEKEQVAVFPVVGDDVFAEEDQMELEDEEVYLKKVEEQIRAMEESERVRLHEEALERERSERLKVLTEAAKVSDQSLQPGSIAFKSEDTRMIIEPESSDSSIAEEESIQIEHLPGHSNPGIDMFSNSPVAQLFERPQLTEVPAESSTIVDNWADAEGYYRFRLGDVLNGRFEVFGFQGRGVFSTVLRVRDRLSGNKEVVLKVIRNNEVMYKAGMKELAFLTLLGERDEDNKKHIVRLYNHFEHRGHLCMVFEPMAMSLRDVLKKFSGQGISLDGVRVYAQQLFVALRHLKKCGILHADIKPDNVLVSDKMNVLKLCDFGSASRFDDCEITPLLVSRFYRPPEVSKIVGN